MTYFPDLSEYAYLAGSERNARHRNIGWLGKGHRFPRGRVPDAALEKLWKLCLLPPHVTRGFHRCEFCRSPPFGGVAAVWKGRQWKLGSAEIRVEGTEGIVYFAPNLVLHYITEHQYLPPAEFLAALAAT